MTRAFDPAGPLAPGVTLIEASAGTGKTWSIASLFLRLVAEADLRVDQVLVVTFTRAATAELRERIRQRLREGVACLERARQGELPGADDPVLRCLVGPPHPPEEREARLRRLRRAAEDFDTAAISTIHGFCQRMLDLHAFEGGTDLDPDLVEDVGPVIEEIVDDFLSRSLYDEDPATCAFLAAAGWQRAALRGLAATVTRAREAVLLPEILEDWRAPWAAWQEAVAAFRALWRLHGADLVDRLCRATGCLNQRTWKPDRVRALAATLEAWLAGPALPQHDLDPWTLFTDRRVQDGVKKGQDHPCPAHPVLHAWERLVDWDRAFVDRPRLAFARHAREELDRRLLARHQQSFDDLLRRLRDRLVDPEGGPVLAAAIRSRFRAALIDEFQDTDPVQWDVFRVVFGGEPAPPRGASPDTWLYLIGDPKQAIYAFRGADVFVYRQAARAAPEERRATLRVNRRSDRRLVEGFNHLLGGRRDVFDLDFIPYDAVEAWSRNAEDGLVTEPARPPLDLRWFAGPDGECMGKGVAGALVPALAAEEVASLLAGARIRGGDGAFRPLAPRDVAVLVRKNRQARDLQEALLARRIPAVIASAGSVLESEEAEAVARWLEAMAEPGLDGPARALAACPLYGWTADRLHEGTAEAWARWMEGLARQAEWLESNGFAAAFQRALAEGGVLARLVALPDGERRITNLRHLVEILHRRATRDRLGASGLLRWLRSGGGREGEAEATELRLESDADAVQVVTLHRSKGLQYPVVLLPYLWDGGMPPGPGALQFHDPRDDHRLKLDLATVDPDPFHVERATREAAQEALRILYVGLTRARHRVVVFWGPVNHAGDSPLAAVLHGGTPGAETEPRLDHGRARVAAALKSGPLALLRDLQALADGSTGTDGRPTVGVGPAPAPTGRPWVPAAAATAAPVLEAAAFRRGAFDATWGRHSYTSLAGHPDPAPPDQEGLDRDAVEPAEQPPEPADEVPLAPFPRGRDPGSYVHRVLELTDFQTLQEKPPGTRSAAEVAREEGRRMGFGEPRWPALLAGELPRIVATPLGPELEDRCLRDIPPAHRLDELRFELPLAGGDGWRPGRAPVSGAALARILARRPATDAVGARWLQRLAHMPFGRLAGYLTGSLDLVFRVPGPGGGRWYVADWKTNRLVDGGGRCTWAAFALPGLAREMEKHAYYLQYHLYLVALHRYLAWRLPGYDYDRNIGGALYLFVRGMPGEESPRDAAGRAPGVFFDRPPREVVEGISTLFDGGGAA